MKEVYEVVQTSKQLHHYHRQQAQQDLLTASQIQRHIQRHRINNKRIGLKKLYHLMTDCPVGRDQFINIALNLGLGVKRQRKYVRTTYSVYTLFTNLIAGQSFDNINQVWVSDITYLKINGQDAYIVFILDIYSKVIVGYNASMTLAASENRKALQMAFRLRKGCSLDGLIHHSDRGSQYIAGDYLLDLYDKNIKVSMCNSALDNAYAERVNGIIKGEYLEHCSFQNLEELKRELKKVVQHYNVLRPHWALKLMSPFEFEKKLKNLTKKQRTILTVAQEHT